MQAVTTISLDIAKSIIQAHGVDGAGQTTDPTAACSSIKLRKRLRWLATAGHS
jgi:hypothetical protein